MKELKKIVKILDDIAYKTGLTFEEVVSYLAKKGIFSVCSAEIRKNTANFKPKR